MDHLEEQEQGRLAGTPEDVDLVRVLLPAGCALGLVVSVVG